MAPNRWRCALLVLGLGCGPARAGPFGPPDPNVFARAEDRARARLLTVPCAPADVGRGCYRHDGRLLRESPCTFHIDANTIGSRPVDQCYKMQPARRFRGVWTDAFEGQSFVPDGAPRPEWPRVAATAPGWREQFDRAQAATIWLDVDRVRLPHRYVQTGVRWVRIEFVGRQTAYSGSYGHMGLSGNEIIVDRILSMREVE